MHYAVVGTGYWGSNHVRVAAALLEEGHLDSVVLCDADEERGRSLAGNYGLEYVPHHGALVDRGVDAAVVATPSPTHREIGCDLLSAGVDVLVEKPLATTARDARALVDCADRNDRTLAAGHIFRCHPALCELERRIDRGELGEVTYLNATRFAFRVPRESAGVLHSLVVHDVDVSNWLLGSTPSRGHCQLDRVVREDVDDTATVTLDYGAATSVVNASWRVPVFGKRRDLVVVGSEAVAYVDYLADNVLELYDARFEGLDGDGASDLRARREGATTVELADREPLRVEVERFLEAVRTGGEPAASGRVGARTVALLEQLAAADAADRVVDLEATAELPLETE